MKALILTVSFASFVLAASAHTRYEHPQNLGRHEDDNVTTRSVPESTPTVALTLVGAASIAVVAAYLRGKKSRA